MKNFKPKLIHFLCFLISFNVLFSCENHKVEEVDKAFYYWKSNEWNFSEGETKILKENKVRKIYQKYFEVDYSETQGCFPYSKTSLSIYNSDSLLIIPVVFIKNEVFTKSTNAELDSLAKNIDYLVNKYNIEKHEQDSVLNEIQIDCDWTLSTKDKYFYFLKSLKKLSNKKLTCTLRLYPYKYPEKMGVPPVDEAMLMCYNLINPHADRSKNSILDTKELEKYLNTKNKYPLHLNIALPTYSWMQVYRNEVFYKVVYVNTQNGKGFLKSFKPLWYTVNKDTVLNESEYLRAGDKVKIEEVKAETINKVIDLLKQNVTFEKQITVALFHLDQEQLSQYSNEEISNFYSAFSK